MELTVGMPICNIKGDKDVGASGSLPWLIGWSVHKRLASLQMIAALASRLYYTTIN
jgi:hypothetical protein